MSEQSTIQGRIAGLLPDDLFTGPPEVTIDRDEILILGEITAPDTGEAGEDVVSEAIATRVGEFRRGTREQRIRVARRLEHEFERKVSWGVRCGGEEFHFTTLAAPAMTRLRMPERAVLDTLIAGGVARSRSEALAWCVRLVAKHQTEWLEDLTSALEHVEEVRAKGPQA
jgi:hypothetical protein